MRDKTEYALSALAELLQLQLEGDGGVVVSGIAALSSATERDLSFYHHGRYRNSLRGTRAAAVILRAEDAADYAGNRLIAENPYLSYARASHLFAKQPSPASGTHPAAQVHDSAVVDAAAAIGPNAVIGANAVIEAGVVIGPNCVIGEDCVIGQNGFLHANVSLYANVRIGKRSVIHAGAVLGSDGFGFAFDGEQQVKIAQLGGLVVGDDVEIGAASSIDRGALDDTIIGDGVKIDNQVQIAHNVKIGRNTVICGCSAVAGSATIGDNCIIAGGVGIINHVCVADEVTVTAMSLVSKSITKKGVYSSGTGLSETPLWKRNIARFRQLDAMAGRLTALEKKRGKK